MFPFLFLFHIVWKLDETKIEIKNHLPYIYILIYTTTSVLFSVFFFTFRMKAMKGIKYFRNMSQLLCFIVRVVAKFGGGGGILPPFGNSVWWEKLSSVWSGKKGIVLLLRLNNGLPVKHVVCITFFLCQKLWNMRTQKVTWNICKSSHICSLVKITKLIKRH